MEFDNLKNDFTNSHLKEALPDLIKENYKFREDIKVEYAGDIRPYITKYRDIKQDSIKGLIINGSFQTSWWLWNKYKPSLIIQILKDIENRALNTDVMYSEMTYTIIKSIQCAYETANKCALR